MNITILGAVEAKLGAGGVTISRDLVHRFEQDGRGDLGRAAAVVRPRTPQEVAVVLSTLLNAGVRIVIQGAASGLVGAGAPDSTGDTVVMSLERLTGAVEIDAVNRSATALAGVRLSQVNAAAEPYGLCLPIDLAADPSLGGMVGANTGGARFIRYGDVRRNTLGLEVAMADGSGRLIDMSAPLWKNNAHLDLKSLFIGSSGVLGVVTKVSMALHPLPRSRRAALIVPADPRTSLDILLALESHAGSFLTAFEGMSGEALGYALAQPAGLRNPFTAQVIPPYALLVELCDSLPGLENALDERLAAALARLLEAGRLTDVLIGAPEPLFAVRHAIPEGLRRAGQVIACDIALRRGLALEFREVMRGRIATRWPHLKVCDFGHIGDGGLHFNLLRPAGEEELRPDEAEAVRDAVFRTVVEEFGGSFSGEHGVGPRNLDHYRRLVPETIREVSGVLQRALAPGPLGNVDFQGA